MKNKLKYDIILKGSNYNGSKSKVTSSRKITTSSPAAGSKKSTVANVSAQSNNKKKSPTQTSKQSYNNDRVNNAVSALAAKNAGIKTDSRGVPIINNGYDANRYLKEYDKIKKNEISIKAATAAGVRTNSYGEPIIIGASDAKAYMEAYESNKLDVNVKKAERSGIKIDEIKMNTNSAVDKPEYTNARSYTVVPNNSPNAGKSGYITESEYKYLIATVAGEAGDVSVSNSYGVASASLNAIENQYDGDVMGFLNNNCWAFGKGYKQYVDNNGNINITGYGTDEGYKNAKIAVDAALSGTRAFPSNVQYWVGNYSYLESNDLLNQYDAFNKFSTTSEESSKFVE